MLVSRKGPGQDSARFAAWHGKFQKYFRTLIVVFTFLHHCAVIKMFTILHLSHGTFDELFRRREVVAVYPPS